MTRTHTCAGIALTLAMSMWTPSIAAAQSMERDRYVLPPESVQELFRRDKNIARLDRLIPDGDHFVIPQFQELTTLKLMSQRTLRLAMLELVPEVNREWRLATYGNYGLNLYSLKERRTYPVKLPAGRARVRRASRESVAGVGRRCPYGRGARGKRCAGDGHARSAAGRRRRSARNGGRAPAPVDA
jgi:hypothetical protein